MADGSSGPPPSELGITPKDLGIKPGNLPARPQEFGRIDLQETPYRTDVRVLQAQYFPEGKYLKIADGSEYILDANGRTIILFEKPTDKGFTSAYSPLTPQDLRRKLATLPEEQQKELAGMLHLPDLSPDSLHTTQATGTLEDLMSRLKSRASSERRPQRVAATDAVSRDIPPDLPDSHFVQLNPKEYAARKAEQWEAVRDLPDNDQRKILYFRRFTREFRSGVRFNPELTASSGDNFRYYGVDTSRVGELPTVEAYRPTIAVSAGRKIGFVIGYHHLEKPWSNLFMEMFQRQVQYSPDQIEFIVIQNTDIPTGDRSIASEREIQQTIAAMGITDIIDVHEQLAMLNHYMDSTRASEFKNTFRAGGSKNPNGGEYTLDPFVPLWAIEQYYQGHIYPQLQDAINEQIKKAEVLIKGLGNPAAKA
ncbi:hypothetical protein HYS92_01805 [Candidatus Daviesbacteria bacterium]|nr:hypothetical protein [Candidatus Daviesbacteria bacterium]